MHPLIMRKYFAVASLLISILSFAQVKWMTLDQAIAAQNNLPKKILIDFYTDGCVPCHIMEKQTFSRPEISAYINEHFYPVKFNAETSEELSVYGRNFRNPDFSKGKKKNSLHEFTKFMNVSSVPSLVFLDEQAHPITILNGMLTAKELDPYLTLISTNEYQKITKRTQWDDYQKKFKSKLKN